jgi:hypothetical protein
MKFVAFDLAVHDGFATNMNIVVEPLPSGMTLDSYLQATLALLDKASFRAGPVDHRRVSLPGGPAEKISYPSEFTFATGKQTLRTLQYAFARDDRGYVITFTTLPTRAEKYEATFTRSARSFRIRP